MFERNPTGKMPRLLMLLLAGVVAGLLGCSGAGGKGLEKQAAREPAEDGEYLLDATRTNYYEAQSGAGSPAFSTREAGEQDPFGLMPVDWPDDVLLHPRSRVAYSGEFGTGGLYVVTLISTDEATALGVQNYHLESLSGWDSLQVGEENPGGDTANRQLTVTAEREGAFLRIISEQSAPGFLSSLDNDDYWREVAGSTPLVVRLYFTPLPTEEQQ